MNCMTFKTAKKGQLSFRITQKLINSIYSKARKAKKKGNLVLTIPCDEKNNYRLDCSITKVKK